MGHKGFRGGCGSGRPARCSAPQTITIHEPCPEEIPDVSTGKLHACLRRMLAKKPVVYGMCVAFKSGLRSDAHYFTQGKLKEKKLGYDPSEWNWFNLPKETLKPLWIAPFFDQNGGDKWMTTFAVPFSHEGTFSGVVTADFSIKHYVEMLREREKILELSEGVYGFLIDQEDRIIGHPKDPKVLKNDHDFKKLSKHKSLEELTKKISMDDSGKVEARDPWYDDRPSSFIFSPVRSTSWNFVLVFPNEPTTSETPRGKWKLPDAPTGGD